MKFTINRAALLERISTAAKAITIPNPRPDSGSMPVRIIFPLWERMRTLRFRP